MENGSKRGGICRSRHPVVGMCTTWGYRLTAQRSRTPVDGVQVRHIRPLAAAVASCYGESMTLNRNDRSESEVIVALARLLLDEAEEALSRQPDTQERSPVRTRRA
jgi:hypothetical protein